MVSTSNPLSYYKENDGCGLNCSSPFFSQSEHTSVSNFVFWGMLVSFGGSAFAVVTFLIGGGAGWKRQGKSGSGSGVKSGWVGVINRYGQRVIFHYHTLFYLVLYFSFRPLCYILYSSASFIRKHLIIAKIRYSK